MYKGGWIGTRTAKTQLNFGGKISWISSRTRWCVFFMDFLNTTLQCDDQLPLRWTEVLPTSDQGYQRWQSELLYHYPCRSVDRCLVPPAGTVGLYCKKDDITPYTILSRLSSITINAWMTLQVYNKWGITWFRALSTPYLIILVRKLQVKPVRKKKQIMNLKTNFYYN